MEECNSAMSVIERLGNVFYWVGCVGSPVVGIFVFGWTMSDYKDSESHKHEIIAYALICAVTVWLTGLAIRYVLNGRGLWRGRS